MPLNWAPIFFFFLVPYCLVYGILTSWPGIPMLLAVDSQPQDCQASLTWANS